MRMEWREKGVLQKGEQGQEKQQEQRHDQHGGWGGPTTRNNSRYTSRRPCYGHARPPLPSCPAGSCQQLVPLWEKRFCTEVCRVPWNKLCQTKRVMPMYNDIVQWDDSAGEEAFNNAKARFWAKINGLPCSIPMPDPYMYIDVVDQDTIIDPKLIEDICKLPPAPDEGNEPGRWDSFLFTDKPVPTSGWDDSDDPITRDFSGLPDPTGWVNLEYDRPYTETLNTSKSAVYNEINPTVMQQEKLYSVNSTINTADNNITCAHWNEWNGEQVRQDKLQFSRNNSPGERYGAKIDGRSGFRGDYSNYRGHYQSRNNFRRGRGRGVEH